MLRWIGSLAIAWGDTPLADALVSRGSSSASRVAGALAAGDLEVFADDDDDVGQATVRVARE